MCYALLHNKILVEEGSCQKNLIVSFGNRHKWNIWAAKNS